MTTTGLTAEGFIPETFQSLREKVFARLRAEFGPIPLDDSTIEGQSWNILIECLTKLWELGETVYSSQDPDKATGAALDALCLLTGTFRQPPSFSQGLVILTGDDATSVPGATNVRIGAAGAVATTAADATLAAADPWAEETDYEVGDIVTNDGQIYYCIAAGTSSHFGGHDPTHTSRPVDLSDPLGELQDGTTPALNDDPLAWVWVGEGEAYAEVEAIAIETGAVNFPAFAISQVVNPLAGLLGVGNSLDFDLGKDLQSDESLREARNNNLAAPGTGTVDAIRAAVLAVDDVISCTVFYNNTDLTDADGVPPHSVECLVRGGEDQAIYDCLLANIAAGIRTYGNTPGSALDSQGTSHSISFSRPVEVPIYVAITLTYDAAKYPEDGDDQVAEEIVAFGDEQDTGKDAIAWSIGACAREVAGTLKVVSCFIGTAPAPALSADIVISSRQLAVFDTSRVDVASSPATP